VVPVQDLLADSNPMVVANAVAALADIRDTSSAAVFSLSGQSLFKLLRALNECTEWGQARCPPAALGVADLKGRMSLHAHAWSLPASCSCFVSMHCSHGLLVPPPALLAGHQRAAFWGSIGLRDACGVEEE
jgi:hypothetical protein